MFKFIFSLTMFQQLDPKVYELQKQAELYRIIIIGSALVILLLVLALVLLRISLGRARRAGGNTSLPGKNDSRIGKSVVKGAVSPKNLPDPGLIFKYSLTKEDAAEKLITIGQTAGSIRTYATEIINEHFNISIRILENRKEKDINNLPDSIYEEYMICMDRAGDALIHYPGSDGFRVMDTRERIYIMAEDDPAGDPAYPLIDPKYPVRIRLGGALDQHGKFANGYFEFHLFTLEYEVKTESGIPRLEKNFMIRLYRIYPGYDVSSPDKKGLYPMIEPFSSTGN